MKEEKKNSIISEISLAAEDSSMRSYIWQHDQGSGGSEYPAMYPNTDPTGRKFNLIKLFSSKVPMSHGYFGVLVLTVSPCISLISLLKALVTILCWLTNDIPYK